MKRSCMLRCALLACLLIVAVHNICGPQSSLRNVMEQVKKYSSGELATSNESVVLSDLSNATFVMSSRLARSDSTMRVSHRESNSEAYASTSVRSISQFEQLGCITHDPKVVNATGVLNQPFVMLEMTMQRGCGPLRRDWRDNPPLSDLAQRILQRQSDCSLNVNFWNIDDYLGIGSHFGQWSQAMCTAMETGVRMRTQGRQLYWLDQTYCNMTDAAKRSPFLCYFPKAEFLCEQTADRRPRRSMNNPRFQKICRRDDRSYFPLFRAASIEFIFRAVSPLVIQEAQRQVGVIFGPTGAPDDLITVHIRWGDKHYEMKLVDAEEYVNATSHLLRTQLGRQREDSTANVFLATEDPLAAVAFEKAAPTSWKIYRDLAVDELGRFRPNNTDANCHASAAKNTLGRGGLLNVASLLVGLEANYFVLTTQSSFSRIINSLRTNIIDPRCGNCTRMIDLYPEVR